MKKFTFIITLIFLFGINYGQQWQWAKMLYHSGYLGMDAQIAADASGDFYLKTSIDTNGTFQGMTVNKGTFIAKFNSSGTVQWVKNFPNAGKIKFNKQNILCITGYFTGTLSLGSFSAVSKGNSDIYVAQINTSGNVTMLRSFGGPGSDKGLGIDAGTTTRIFITGSFEDSLSFDSYKLNNPNNKRGFYAACLDSSLGTIWAVTNTLTSACGYEISADQNNNCYTWSTFTDTICYTWCRYDNMAKFSSSGTQLLSVSNNEVNSGHDFETMNGSMFDYGFGCSHQNCGTSAWKYDDQMIMQWYKNWYDYYHVSLTHGIVTKNKESIVAGSYGYAVQDSVKFDSVWVKKKGYGNDVMITKLDSTGKHLWFATGGGYFDEGVVAITSDKAGNYFAFGYMSTASWRADTLIIGNDTLISNGQGYNYFIAKLSEGVAANVHAVAGNNNSDVLIYPNPSKGKVHFNNLQNASLRVFNYLGQDVFYTSHGQDIELDQPSGVYFVEVTSSNKRTIKKLIIE